MSHVTHGWDVTVDAAVHVADVADATGDVADVAVDVNVTGGGRCVDVHVADVVTDITCLLCLFPFRCERYVLLLGQVMLHGTQRKG
jgi:hypothetical protein